MRDFRIDNKGTARLFDNKILERLTRTHFSIPVFIYLMIAVLSVYYGFLHTVIEPWKLIYLFPIGFVTFTLVEYLIHRYIFHFSPSNEKEEKLQYSIHGVHHEFPRDKDRLVMPPVLSLVIAIAFFGFFILISGDYGWFIFSGFSSGYSIYLLIHYAIHRYRPPANFLKYLWKHHSLHHYSSTESAFSVSMPLWDFIFGTMPVGGKNRKENTDNKLPDYHHR